MTFLSLAEAKIGGYLPVQATLSEVRRIMMLNEPSLRSDSAFFITESTWPELVFVGLSPDAEVASEQAEKFMANLLAGEIL
jgi:hypothetical protein